MKPEEVQFPTAQRVQFLMSFDTLETLAPVCDDLTVSLPAAQRD